MKENDNLLPYLKKVQKLQIKYFGKVSLWLSSYNDGFFVVTIFLRGSNETIDFYRGCGLNELDITYKRLLKLIKEKNDEQM